jgi:hypothetical protein
MGQLGLTVAVFCGQPRLDQLSKQDQLGPDTAARPASPQRDTVRSRARLQQTGESCVTSGRRKQQRLPIKPQCRYRARPAGSHPPGFSYLTPAGFVVVRLPDQCRRGHGHRKRVRKRALAQKRPPRPAASSVPRLRPRALSASRCQCRHSVRRRGTARSPATAAPWTSPRRPEG